MTNKLTTAAEGGNLAAYAPDTLLDVQTALCGLLAKRTALYTMNESCSVPQDTAQDLLDSVCYTLGIDPATDSDALTHLVGVDLEKRFDRGVKSLVEKISYGKKLWQTACVSLPELENRSLTDTLTSIGQGWKYYDYRYFAQEFPCDIDYQLGCPVPETLRGVDYINEYLRRILLESRFLRRFPAERAARLLTQSCPDYRGLPINLYEPVAVNALGLLLIESDPLSLDISASQREMLCRMLRPLDRREVSERLHSAAVELCRQLTLLDAGTVRYLGETAEALCPRIRAALGSGDLSELFLSLEPQER